MENMNAVETKENEKRDLDELGGEIVDAIYCVHIAMGVGLNEAIYKACLLEELRSRDIVVEEEVKFEIEYKGKKLDKYYFADIVVENSIVLELKSVSELLPIHEAQLMNYLRLAKMKLGYLVNFNVKLIREGIKRRKIGYW
jgi:GxxExxY protein